MLLMHSLPCMHAEGVENGGLRDIIPEAHAFLAEQGCVNLGVPAGEPPKPAEEPEALAPEALVAAVYALLKTVDLEVRGLPSRRLPWLSVVASSQAAGPLEEACRHVSRGRCWRSNLLGAGRGCMRGVREALGRLPACAPRR